jgi:hypothetical protein
VHLSDRRNPPDFGRIAWPEDILASVEVDEAGEVVGKAQPSGTYRILTNEGMCVYAELANGMRMQADDYLQIRPVTVSEAEVGRQTESRGGQASWPKVSSRMQQRSLRGGRPGMLTDMVKTWLACGESVQQRVMDWQRVNLRGYAQVDDSSKL